MDFGVVGFDGLVGSSSTSASHDSAFASLPSSDPEHHTKHKWYGSGGVLIKQDRTGSSQDDWRNFKSMKSDDFSTSTSSMAMLFCDTQQSQNMLSFSSPKPEAVFLRNDGLALPYFQHTQPTSTSAYSRNTGFGAGGINGVRGPFTPSQWMELEHQALIYKYITANAPIPSNLLIPIRKALDSAGLPCFSGGPLRPNTLGWGAFHLGFTGHTDPEPGRCRRTDGKKWRCSRDAVADQKYCERHMNRGRHRSRKPVEGQMGHSVAGATAVATANPKLIPMVGPAVVSGSGASNISQHQLQRGASIPSAASSLVGRALINKENVGERPHDSPGLSILSPTINLRSKENPFSVPKQQNPYEQSPRTEFGLVPTDFLLNASNKSASFMGNRNFASSPNRDTESQHSLRHFMDDWPKNQLDLQSERTQLSISIPVNSSDFMSSSSTPTTENLALSPLRLSREFDPIQMGLGVGSALNESNQRQANWIPISWEDSVGGPLGEVLQNTNNNNAEHKNLSGLNLMTEAWDGSPRLGSSSVSSPTGVLQKTAFGSLSNSSAGSSPRTENNKTHEGASLCDDLLGSTLKKSPSL